MLQKRQTNKGSSSAFRSVIQTNIFGVSYLVVSLIVLISTTVYWSILGAKIQLANADQLVNNFLFSKSSTFHGATFPSTHTFLIKWPIFWLINIFGSTNNAVNFFTVALVLLTVLSLVAIIYRIDKRPLVCGTIFLAIASVLLMVPATSYAGAFLPVNMAMITTRNIEYVLYILGFILLLRKPKVLSFGFLLSAICLSLLVASDKLFFVFIVGSALIAVIIYTRARQWRLVSMATNWFILGIISIIGAYLVLGIISHTGVTHLTTQGTLSPYNLSSGFKNTTIGVIYAIMAVFTNLGANPAYQAVTVRGIPHQLFNNLFSVAGPAYIINGLILVFGLVVIFRVTSKSWKDSLGRPTSFTRPVALAIFLIWTTVAAFFSFVLTNHDYEVDARYLTIIFFTIFIAIAAYARSKKWPSEGLVIVGAVLMIGIVFGIFGSTQNYHHDQAALAVTNLHNNQVARALSSHHVSFIVGDYWRVVPIKQVSDNLGVKLTKAQIAAKVSKKTAKGQALTVMPVTNCTVPIQDQSSATWKPNLAKTRFAYLLTISGDLTSSGCSISQVTTAYGKPNASSLISGTLSHPSEILLYYDSGSHVTKSPAATTPIASATVLPISLGELPFTSCSQASVMNIVAHEDDDLLFMNPDLYNEIKSGDCIRSIYVTAGNAGVGSFYWLAREEGTEAAYSYMLGDKDDWTQSIVSITANEYISVASPEGNPNISLIFMHLPDGNLQGEGFASSNFESLKKLENGNIKVINSVDNQSHYTSTQLINALSTLMNIYQPSIINTQSGVVGTQYTDHSDHLSVDWFATKAYQKFETVKYNNQVSIPFNHYIGYPIHGMSTNLTPTQVQMKYNVFLTYAKYDTHVCQTMTTCQQDPAYGSYLVRQYKSSY